MWVGLWIAFSTLTFSSLRYALDWEGLLKVTGSVPNNYAYIGVMLLSAILLLTAATVVIRRGYGPWIPFALGLTIAWCLIAVFIPDYGMQGPVGNILLAPGMGRIAGLVVLAVYALPMQSGDGAPRPLGNPTINKIVHPLIIPLLLGLSTILLAIGQFIPSWTMGGAYAEMFASVGALAAVLWFALAEDAAMIHDIVGTFRRGRAREPDSDSQNEGF
jgi:hypothetical protein